jgi:DNA-binding IclR family transcriptional regulator
MFSGTERIRSALRRSALTLDELAERSGVSRRSIHNRVTAMIHKGDVEEVSEGKFRWVKVLTDVHA